ncbi:MAG: hypothetical protein JW892_17570 [Anaerolineae bacterium]|nr:hypothetical protein [Anaerolineae bacterium]
MTFKAFEVYRFSKNTKPAQAIGETVQDFRARHGKGAPLRILVHGSWMEGAADAITATPEVQIGADNGGVCAGEVWIEIECPVDFTPPLSWQTGTAC